MTEKIFEVAYGVWNNLITVAMTLFTTSPTAASGSIYSTTRSMYNAISNVALPITIVFFLIAICKDVTGTPPEQQVRKFLGDAIKFGILVGILANLWDVMGYIMQIADGLTDKLSGYGSGTYLLSVSSDLSSALTEASEMKPTTEIHFVSFGTDLIAFASELLSIAFTQLLFFIGALITLGITVASCISILSSAFQRILKPLAILPFSSVTVAMASGTAESSRVTSSYLKTFFGFCISGAFMVICVKLGVALINGGLISFDYASLDITSKLLYITVQNAVAPIVISGLVKSADSIIGRFF
ncbi:MAG: hypothetical protein PHY47_09480 [Lachnospiraceae bacterium]|nr:hypothetical protein [Lachnospiraceae bacterium]